MPLFNGVAVELKGEGVDVAGGIDAGAGGIELSVVDVEGCSAVLAVNEEPEGGGGYRLERVAIERF